MSDVASPPRGLPHSRERGRTFSTFFSDNFESLKELVDRQRFEVFRKMRRSDPTVSASIKSIELPITQGTFDVQPPSEPTELESEQASKIGNWLFDKLDWPQVVRSAITSLSNGFALFEKVYERRGNYIIPSKLGFRPQRTIEDVERNNRGEISAFIQQIDGRRVSIPRNKSILITIDSESEADWQGQSVLRAAYKPWYIKEKMEIVNATGIERFSAGIPVLKAPEGVEPNDSNWSIAEAALKNIHAGTQAYAVLPFGWELEILERKTNPDDPLPFIRELKDDIKIAVLANHLRLGGQGAGSRALGVAFVDSFLHAVQSWANLICDAFNRDLIRELVDVNWAPQEDMRYPKLTVTNIYKSALTELAYLAQTGIIPVTPELVRYIFEQYGIRLEDPEAALNRNNQNNNQNDQDDGVDNNATDGEGMNDGN